MLVFQPQEEVMSNICPLCQKRISDWMMADGKCVLIANKVVHKACTMDHDLSIKELEQKVRES